MGKPTTVRQAKLRTDCARRYPTLPVRMWTSAASLANLVASFEFSDAEEIAGKRALLDRDFEFRGGRRRWLPGWVHSRAGEVALTPQLSS